MIRTYLLNIMYICKEIMNKFRSWAIEIYRSYLLCMIWQHIWQYYQQSSQVLHLFRFSGIFFPFLLFEIFESTSFRHNETSWEPFPWFIFYTFSHISALKRRVIENERKYPTLHLPLNPYNLELAWRELFQSPYCQESLKS